MKTKKEPKRRILAWALFSRTGRLVRVRKSRLAAAAAKLVGDSVRRVEIIVLKGAKP